MDLRDEKGRFKKGHVPWHKGTVGGGIKAPTNGSFKKGHKPHHAGKKKPLLSKTCKTCDVLFYVPQWRKTAKYCSVNCSNTDPTREQERKGNSRKGGLASIKILRNRLEISEWTRNGIDAMYKNRLIKHDDHFHRSKAELKFCESILPMSSEQLKITPNFIYNGKEVDFMLVDKENRPILATEYHPMGFDGKDRAKRTLAEYYEVRKEQLHPIPLCVVDDWAGEVLWERE